MRLASLTLVLAALAIVSVACGGEPEDNAVEARETNSFELDGLRYKVVMFREINPRTPPDQALVDGLPAEGRKGLFAAFMEACNEAEETRTPTSQIQLEDAFGEVYPQVDIPAGNPLGYEPRPIRPGRCLPVEDGTAERSLSGAAVLFKVPFDALSNRPFVLQFRDSDGGERAVRRVQLDL